MDNNIIMDYVTMAFDRTIGSNNVGGRVVLRKCENNFIYWKGLFFVEGGNVVGKNMYIP